MGPPCFRGSFRGWFRGVLAVALLASLAAPAAAQDRLDRFRALGREGLATATDPAAHERTLAELYELVDDEVLDSLRGDESFSSLVFIRERLDAFMDAWGGATLRVLRVPGAAGRAPLTIGLYSLAGVDGSGSLRIYAGTGRSASLAASSTQDGLLDAQVWPAGPDRVARVLALWSGSPTGAGLRSLRAELWEGRGDDRVRRAWSTAGEWPDGLSVSDWRAQPGVLVVRYQTQYPGWKPGCPGQTELEDHFRLAAAGGLALARRQVINGWSRELGAAADRLFRALAQDDARALVLLVTAPDLRARLPRSLVPEPVCEEPAAVGGRSAVTVAASEIRDGTRRPWALSWTRTPAGWRLSAAAPVLQ
jgi:hypothetical protein